MVRRTGQNTPQKCTIHVKGGARDCAITVHYARELADTPVKVNGAAPGHVATDFNGFRGTRTPEQGAAIAVRLATLGDDGPTGGVFEDAGALMW